ncbi:MAG: hypothetical protein A2036_01615 [Omnitrophica bacterium GWA2_50_21]|nr:MAG: hypothetical protein A2036_01615 [Omnitrophica bacterium GWA2_50_21]
MKRIIPLILALLLTSCAPMTEGEKMISNGRKIFLRRCSPCHGVHAEGKPGIPSLKEVTDRFTDDAIRSFIKTGRGNAKPRMPPIRRISGQEVTRVIIYLKTLKPEPAG